MLRKQVVPKRSSESASFEGEISIPEVATVQVTSEELDHPIDNAFDHKRGPGGSRWTRRRTRGADSDPALRQPADDRKDRRGGRGAIAGV
jgi:hypothetical protein